MLPNGWLVIVDDEFSINNTYQTTVRINLYPIAVVGCIADCSYVTIVDNAYYDSLSLYCHNILPFIGSNCGLSLL